MFFKKIFLVVLIIFLSQNIFAKDLNPDLDYYQKGINFYKNAEFDRAFSIFLELADKGDTDAQFNLTNMYSGGIGTTQDYTEALKWNWLCSLGGEKKCNKKIEKLIKKIDQKTLEAVTKDVENFLKNKFSKTKEFIYALKLGFWHEKFSPEKNLEQAYMWYSVSVTGGLYKAMKIRNDVSEQLDAEVLIKLQSEANKIFLETKSTNIISEK